MYSVCTLRLHSGCQYGLPSREWETMELVMILLPYSSASILNWDGGSWLRFTESHGSDLALEGMLVSHSLWYSKLMSGFRKRISLHTRFSRYSVYHLPPNQHQRSLQAEPFVGFQNIQWYTISFLSQHLKVLAIFFPPCFGPCFSQMDTGEKRNM